MMAMVAEVLFPEFQVVSACCQIHVSDMAVKVSPTAFPLIINCILAGLLIDMDCSQEEIK